MKYVRRHVECFVFVQQMSWVIKFLNSKNAPLSLNHCFFFQIIFYIGYSMILLLLLLLLLLLFIIIIIISIIIVVIL